MTFAFSAFAQKVTVSPEILLREDYSFTLLGQVSNKILLLRNKGYSQTLSVYNEGLGFIQEIPLEFEDRKVNLIGFVTTENDFNTYYSFKNEGKEYIKSVKMSSTGEIFYQDTVFVRENAFLSEYYKFDGSNNDRYIVLFNDVEDNQLQIMLYDNQEMTLMYETKITVQGISMRKDFRKIAVSNTGEISILFEKYNSIYRKEAHHYRMVNMDIEGNVMEKQVPLSGKMTNDVQLLCNNERGTFNVVGLYSTKYENISNGYFVYSEDSVYTNPFPKTMIDNISRNEKKPPEGIQDYKLNDVLYRQDGGYILVMEANREFYRATNARNFRGSGYRASVTDYYTEDVVVVSAGPLGDFEWNSVLPKKQFSQDDEGIYSSFFIFKTPTKLRFIYNDEIKNNNTVSEYVLNPAGVFERNSVLSTAYQKLKLRLRNSIQISNNSFLLTSERNNRINIVKIEY